MLMTALCPIQKFSKVLSMYPENRPEKVPHPLKLDGENVLNRQ